MKLRRVLALSIVVIVTFAAAAAPVSAGGWATIELSKPVDSAVIGEPVTFEFQVLQHGMPEKAVEGDAPTVVATHADSGDKLESVAIETAKGHYSATLTFDRAGRWKLHASSSSFPSSSMFPTLNVTAKGELATPASDSAAVATEEVQIINSSFVPSRLEVAAGTTVEFVNYDTTKHEVAIYEASIDDSGIIDKDDAFVVTFIEPGEYHIACGPHPGMSATIVVK